VSDSKSPTPLVIKNSKVYDGLKYVAQIFLPALGTLYFGMAQAWGWSNGTEVVGTLVAVDTFLGVLLHLSSVQYNNSTAKYDGVVRITENNLKKNYSLDLHDDIEEIDNKKQVLLKVVKPKTSV